MTRSRYFRRPASKCELSMSFQQTATRPMKSPSGTQYCDGRRRRRRRLAVSSNVTASLWTSIQCLVGVGCCLATPAAGTTPEPCMAFESSYHVDKGCQCVVFESNGRSEGTFQSIGYPAPYPLGLSCILYSFVGDFDELVQLSFTRFDLHHHQGGGGGASNTGGGGGGGGGRVASGAVSGGGAVSGCTDYVRIYLDLERPELNGRQRPNYELCGNLTATDPSLAARTIYSWKRSAILEFRTGPIQRNHTGFKGTYRFIDAAQFQMPSITNQRRSSSTAVGNPSPSHRPLPPVSRPSTTSPGRPPSSNVPAAVGIATLCVFEFRSSHQSLRSGRFFSPLFPQSYPVDVDCVYRFHAIDTDERIVIQFHSVNLGTLGSLPDRKSSYRRGGSDCVDSVVVHDGNDTSSPVLNRFCGGTDQSQRSVLSSVTSSPSPPIVTLTSSGSQLTVWFSSRRRPHQVGQVGNGSVLTSPTQKQAEQPVTMVTYTQLVPRQSFEASFRFTTNLEPAEKSSGVDVVERPSSDDQQVVLSRKIHNDSQHRGTGSCSADYNSNLSLTGTFASPLFPNPYPADVECVYKLIGRQRQRVQLSFDYFELNYAIGDQRDPYTCENCDNLVIDLGAGTPLYYCGSRRPPLLMSAGPRMQLTFNTIAVSSASGFSATYAFVTDFGIKTGEQSRETECRFIYRSKAAANGSFTSPNFPGLYPRNTTCLYEFYGRSNERVFIVFSYFEVEGITPKCLDDDSLSDFVAVSSLGPPLPSSGSAIASQRVCGDRGENTKHKFQSDPGSSSLYVVFKSNHQFDATGFEAHFQFRRSLEVADHTLYWKQPRPSSGQQKHHHNRYLPLISLAVGLSLNLLLTRTAPSNC